MQIIKDRLILFPVGLALILFVASLFIAGSIGVGTSGNLVLNYDENGIPILGDSYSIIGISLIFGVFIAINCCLIKIIYEKEKFASHLISFTTLLIGIIVLFVINTLSQLN